MNLGEALFDFFGRRIAERGQYGPVEYIVYGAIMLSLLFFLLYPLLDRKGLKFNFRFALALLPYILLGSTIRVLEDMHLLPRSPSPFELGYWVITPGIYVSVAVVTIACLFAAMWLAKKKGWEFEKVFGAIGVGLAAPIALFELTVFKAWPGFIAVFALVAVLAGALIFVFNRFTKLELLKGRLNQLVLVSQLLDGSATFVAIQFFSCGEQHPLSDFFLKLFPFSFVAVKVALVLVILHYVDKEIENKNMRRFIKIVVATLGLATGLRDVFTLGVGTCL